MNSGKELLTLSKTFSHLYYRLELIDYNLEIIDSFQQ